MVPPNIKNRVLGSSSVVGYLPTMHEGQSPALHTKELQTEFKNENRIETPARLIRTYTKELKAGTWINICIFMLI